MNLMDVDDPRNPLSPEEHAILNEPLEAEDEGTPEALDEEEQPENEADDDAAGGDDDDEEEQDAPSDEGDSIEIDGIKFVGVVTADGKNQMPISVVQALRAELKQLKAAKAETPPQDTPPEEEAPAPKVDKYPHLREMSLTERYEYALESDEQALEVEAFGRVLAVETIAEEEMAETVTSFVAANEERMADPVYYGAIKQLFNKFLASGKRANEAMRLSAEIVNKRLGYTAGDSETPPKEEGPDKQEVAERIRGNRRTTRATPTLARTGADTRATDDSTPDLNGDDVEIAADRYSKMTPEQQEAWRLKGR